MAIIYNNDLGAQISIQQANEIGNYIKLFTEQGIPNKKEFYSDGVLIGTSYLVRSQEEIDRILFITPDTSFEFSTILGKYEVLEYRNYKQKLITEKSISVTDIEINELICYRKMKLVENVLTTYFTEKYYHDENGDEKYIFDYNPDGTSFKIYDEQDNSEFFAWDIGVDSDLTFTWQGFEYYQNSEPLLPE